MGFFKTIMWWVSLLFGKDKSVSEKDFVLKDDNESSKKANED